LPSTTENNSAEILAKFAATYKKIDLSLDRLQTFLAEIGNPQNSLPPVIHLAGTNGKGSTLAFLRAMLEAAGHSIHAYTSPHLVKFNERIMLNGKDISDEYLAELLAEIDALTDAHPLTYFEKTTALAFLAFARNKADFLLLETGLGGTHDATNIVDEKLLTIITPISIDHVEYLGSDLLGIAAEKAGIMRKNTPCILAQQSPEVEKFFDSKTDYKIIKSTPRHFEKLALFGEFQHINASTAVAAAKQLGIASEHIETGLKTAKWPARMQKIESGKLFEFLPENCELWLDGGHNEAGGAAIASSIKPDHIIMGMLKSKDLNAFLQHFDPHHTTISTITISSMPEAEESTNIAKITTALGFVTNAEPNIETAFQKLQFVLETKPTKRNVLVCGSLYLAGEFLEKNYGRTKNN